MDHASSTPVDERVRRKMDAHYRSYYANPSSLHKEGVRENELIQNARETIARSINAHSDELIFTSGGTESDNTAIKGLLNAVMDEKDNKKLHIVTTNIEHAAVQDTLAHMEREGAEVTYVPVKNNGIVDPSDIRDALQTNTTLVVVMYANNEIGTIQPIKEIAKVLRQYKKLNSSATPYLYVDASQAIQYIDINVEALGVDLLSFAASKIYGPKGIGALYKRRGVPLASIMHGGNQEFGLRPGTENTEGIIGFEESIRLNDKMKLSESTRLKKLQEYFLHELILRFDEVIINGDQRERLPNNINISFPGIESERLVLEFDAKGIAVSSKSACKSDESELSYVISALRENANIEEGSIRFSLGRSTTKKDVSRVLKILEHIIIKIHSWK